MLRAIAPIALIIASAIAFFGYVDPVYDDIQELRVEEARFDKALKQAQELRDERDALLAKYNQIPEEDLERLEKILPDNVDNVRLILDINGIAARYGMSLRGVSVHEEDNQNQSSVQANSDKYGSLVLQFSVSSSYGNFVEFLKDLEDSLRIVDVTSISFSSADRDLYEYGISLKTYWLK